MTSEGQERVVTSTTGTVVIWAVPRSVSTAFEKALSRSQGVVAVHEPFTDCYYFGPTRRSSRARRGRKSLLLWLATGCSADPSRRPAILGDQPVREKGTP